MRFITGARIEKMGSYSRGQSMDSIYRIKAFSSKNTLACRPCPQSSPSPHDIIWLLQQPCLMSTAVDDYHLHLIARPREVKRLAQIMQLVSHGT